MTNSKVYRAIGLMSGTSLDGVIDVALIETDGNDYVKPLAYYEHPYDINVRDKVRACFGKIEYDKQTEKVERLVTDIHIDAVKAFRRDADVIGFHGQTITHNPKDAFTWQLGDGKRLAAETGIDVVADMRQNDMKHGGQGAPLLPLYHRAMMADVQKPVIILNLGGVANVTYIGLNGELIAFDCGPANALMDDFVKQRLGIAFDKNGVIAARGQAHKNILEQFCKDAFFDLKPPKSLDRNHWNIDCVRYASDEDGMATLLEMTLEGVVRALDYVPEKLCTVYVAGGGRKNSYMIGCLRKRLALDVLPVDSAGWDGDATEAEGFAYLAVRSLLGLPLTVPETTGVRDSVSGGKRYLK